MTPHPRASEPTQDSPEVTVWRLRLLKAETENARLLAALKEETELVAEFRRMLRGEQPFDDDTRALYRTKEALAKARALLARLEGT
jgi:hypothetical protein